MSTSNQGGSRHPWASLRAAGSRGAAVVALVVALFLAVSSVTSAMAATAIVIGGLGATSLPDSMMKLALGGRFTGTDPVSKTQWVRKAVTWPAQAGPILGTIPMGKSVAVGTANMLEMIKSTYAATGGAITVFGMSEGSAVVDEVMRALAKDPSAPPPSALNFVVAGDANHRQKGFIPHTYGGYKFQKPAETPYNLSVVTYEYDGWSDWPDDVWNALAAKNALAGAVLLHNKTYYVDLATVPAADITVKKNASGGYTTYYLVRTDILPIVVMNPKLAPQAAELKKKIDAAYGRNAGVTPTTPAPSGGTGSTGSGGANSPLRNLWRARMEQQRENWAPAREERQEVAADRRADTAELQAANVAERQANAEQRTADRQARAAERQAGMAERAAHRQAGIAARAANREARAADRDARAASRRSASTAGDAA